MLIKCPGCRQSYEVPERFYGKKFYCPKCQTRVRTKPLEVADVTAIPVLPDAPEPEPESEGTRRRTVNFQKESAPQPLVSALSFQQFCMVIGFVGIAVALIVVLMVVGGGAPGAKRTEADVAMSAGDDSTADNPSGPPNTRAANAPDAAGNQLVKTDDASGQRVVKNGMRSNSSIDVSVSERSRDSDDPNAGDSRLDVDHEWTFEMRPGERVRLHPNRAGGGLLGPIPLMDITWDTNSPAYSLRLLESTPLSGLAMEKVVRTYGSSEFLERYRALLDSEDYTVRFYAALGLANFGRADDRVISILLKSIAQSRSRQAYRLRVDWANELLRHYRSLVIPALQKLLSDPDAEVAGFAVEYLALLGRDSREAIPQIATLVDRRDLYVPYNDSLFKTLKLGDLARVALRRLAADAADAIPELEKQMEREEDPEIKREILDLIAWIASKSGRRTQGEWPAWARSYGIPLLPVDARSVLAFRLPHLRRMGFDTLPRVANVLNSLEESSGVSADSVDLITLATYDQGDSLWERRPFVAIIRLNTLDAIAPSSLTPERQVGDQKIRDLAPDLAWKITGERTLVVGTIPELLHMLGKARSPEGPRHLVIPDGDREPAYLECTPTESHAIYLAEQGEAVGHVQREYWLQRIADDAESILRQRATSGVPVPEDNTDNGAKNWWETRIKQPDVTLHQSGSRLSFEFPLSQSELATTDWLSALPWRPSDGTALRAWRAFQQGLRIERAPYTDAAGMVRREMGSVNDVDRKEVNEIIRWCLADEQIGPTTRLPMDVEERRNRLAWTQYALRWADSETLDALAHLLNAMQLEPGQAIPLLLESKSPKALAMIAEWASRSGGETLEPEWLGKLAARIEHALALGEVTSLGPSVQLCERYPGLAMAVLPRLEQLAGSTRLEADVATTVNAILQRESTFHLPETDDDKMDEYAAESGMANAGLALGQKLHGRPPAIKRLEPYLHPARTFDVMLPYVHPDLVSVEMDGPVNEYSDDYARIDGLRYFVARGDVVTVSRRRYDPANFATDWDATSEFLGEDLIRDEAGPTSDTLDRYRMYMAQGIPKGQRGVMAGEWLYEVRWIGRNHSQFPAYVHDILLSLKPRPMNTDKDNADGAEDSGADASENSRTPPGKKDRPKAKLNAPGNPDKGLDADG